MLRFHLLFSAISALPAAPGAFAGGAAQEIWSKAKFRNSQAVGYLAMASMI
jgi:hypothetical protein